MLLELITGAIYNRINKRTLLECAESPKKKGNDGMKKRRIISALLAAVLAVGGLAGCGEKANDGKVTIEPGHWPAEKDVEDVERYEGFKTAFEEKYPDVTIKGGNIYAYDVQTFAMKAASGQLPTYLNTYFTEIQQMIAADQVADITDELKANNLYDKLNPEILELCSDENGRVYAFPKEAYAIGLVINKDLFTKAGLVNEDGSPKVPDTYQELAEYSQIIKEKTGVPGFVLPTTGNGGGWVFMNIAWSMGVEFEEQQSDGSWKAVFDTPQFKKALQYVKDLKWKYNALPDNKVIDVTEQRKIVGVGQAAMTLASPDVAPILVNQYGMNKDNIFMSRVPKGDAGRYAQMGGGVTIFNKNSSSEQIDAGLKWLMFATGRSPEITEEIEANMRANNQAAIDNGGIVFPKTFFDVWTDKARLEKCEEIAADYANVDMKNYEQYAAFEDVTLRPEETVCCQQLYAVLDGVIQEVITNENADIDALTKQAVNDFQKNHLDNYGK